MISLYILMSMKQYIKAIDPRMVFGFGLLMILAFLAAILALGKVHMETSYGLDIVLGSLTTLSGGFAQWAFSGTGERPVTERPAASSTSPHE